MGCWPPYGAESTRVGTGATAAGSRRMCRTSCGVRTRRGSTRRRMGGAGSSWWWITASQTWWAGTCSEEGRSVGSARADPPGCTNPHPEYAPKIALGLGLRHDWGPQYHRPSVPRRAGLARDPLDGLVRRRAGVQRRRGTLHADAEGRVPVPPDFESLEEARQEIDAFIERYNRGWLLERHGYRTPAQVRQELTLKAA